MDDREIVKAFMALSRRAASAGSRVSTPDELAAAEKALRQVSGLQVAEVMFNNADNFASIIRRGSK